MLDKNFLQDLIFSLLKKNLTDNSCFSSERYYLARAFSQDDLVAVFDLTAQMYAEAATAVSLLEENDADYKILENWVERLEKVMDLLPIPSEHQLRGNIHFINAAT